MEATPRRRIDIGDNVYLELEREARWLSIAPGALATLLIREGLVRMRRDSSPALRLNGGRDVLAEVREGETTELRALRAEG